MRRTNLVIMAAGIGSRFGGGIKQLAPVGVNGEIIMDYSIHDAIEAGFNKIIFVIRKDIESDFMQIIGNRIEKICNACGVEVAYGFQSIEDIPGNLPEERIKPWGTGQAVLAAKDVIDSPFAVINADDYYGKHAFKLLHDYLVTNVNDNAYCMAGFILKNTLSDNGGVTRGVCTVDDDNMLLDVVETSNIEKCGAGAMVGETEIDSMSYVSMNMWGFTESFIELLEKGFQEFFEKVVPTNPNKAEFLLPIYVGELLHKGAISVKLLETADKWFGVTYKEDTELVVESFKKLIEEGIYKEELYSDLM